MKKYVFVDTNAWSDQFDAFMKNSWNLLFGLLVMFALGCTPEGSNLEESRPNIVLIMADDLGYETLGAYGNKIYQTPNLDKLASTGMRFDHCYSTPLCTPSRVQLMTGKYNFRNYIGFGLLDPEERTFGHLLSEAGYETCVVGKWQLLGNKKQIELAGGRVGSWPEEAGFDEYCLWQIDTLGSRYRHPTVTSTGRKTTTIPDGYGPDVFIDFIEQFIENCGEAPFFLYYPMVLTHDPFVPTPDLETFENDVMHRNKPEFFPNMVHYMDSIIGRIVKKLHEEKIHNNTLVLFIGDNGTDRKVISEFRGKPFKGNKGFTNEAGTRVPFIANWPGVINERNVNNNLVDFTDFLPSVMEAAGVELPGSFFTDGTSFYPQLMGENVSAREWVFCHYDPNWGKFEKSRYIHNKVWKLYEDGKIFNIKEDPEERHIIHEEELNLQQKRVIEELKSVLTEMN